MHLTSSQNNFLSIHRNQNDYLKIENFREFQRKKIPPTWVSTFKNSNCKHKAASLICIIVIEKVCVFVEF